MTKEDFYTANVMEADGWEFLYDSDDGYMVFSRLIGGVVFTAKVAVEK